MVVLGAGFGGLQLAARLSEAIVAGVADGIDVVLVDSRPGFVFGFSKLDVMFGRSLPEQVVHPYTDLSLPGVRFVPAEVISIDPHSRVVQTTAGPISADILVLALGAELEPGSTPGLVEDGHEFYTVDGAFALRDVLDTFAGGRVIVGVTATPFKCPPAPSEAALLMHQFLERRGLTEVSDITLVMPFGVPIPPSPDASAAVLANLAERGISWHGDAVVLALDPARRTAVLSDGAELPYDLFLGVPVHRVPDVVEASGLAVDGWIPVDPLTLETRYPDVYAVGDVTSVGTPKAGVFAEGQADVVADRIVARLQGATHAAEYDGRGVLLPRVRRRPRRQGRRGVPYRRDASRSARWSVAGPGTRQGGLRIFADQAMVRA